MDPLTTAAVSMGTGWIGRQLGLGPKAPKPSNAEQAMGNWLGTVTPYAKQYLQAANPAGQLPQMEQGYQQARNALTNYRQAYAPGQGAGTQGLFGQTLSAATRGLLGALGQGRAMQQARFSGSENSMTQGVQSNAVRALMQVLAQGENQRAQRAAEAERYASQVLPGLYAGPMQQRMGLAQLGAGLGGQSMGGYAQMAGMNDQRNAQFAQQQAGYGQMLGELLAQAMAARGRQIPMPASGGPTELSGYGGIGMMPSQGMMQNSVSPSIQLPEPLLAALLGR